MDTETLDLVGAVTAMVIHVSSIVTFSVRLAVGVGAGHWVGVPILLAGLPLGHLLGVSFLAGRAWGATAVVLFLVAGTLAFVQRAVTGV